MNGLDLFSGIGGLSLALRPYVRTVAYCEVDRYCQGVLLSRMRSGDLSQAPIWDDVRTLKGELLPQIDIIYGGFPCQDISVAGHGKGLEGTRSGLVSEIFRLAHSLEPTFLFLENVPAIRTRGAERVGKELALLGYDCRWFRISAQDVGALHKRQRWFLLAAHPDRIQKWLEHGGISGSSGENQTESRYDGQKESLADSKSIGSVEEGLSVRSKTSYPRTGIDSEYVNKQYWETEPSVGRVVDGLPFRVDRLRGLGNAVVPIQAREAFEILMGLK